jgi:hypothetical protein
MNGGRLHDSAAGGALHNIRAGEDTLVLRFVAHARQLLRSETGMPQSARPGWLGESGWGNIDAMAAPIESAMDPHHTRWSMA